MIGALRLAVLSGLLGVQMASAAEPTIHIDEVPLYGLIGDLRGHIEDLEDEDCMLAVFANVYGWWNKPSWEEPTIPVPAGGSFALNPAPLPTDRLATEIAVYLLPSGTEVPLLEGNDEIPQSLRDAALAFEHIPREPRWIEFSGMRWWVKSAPNTWGPGPNIFSDSEENVWVDDDGTLHLKVTNRDGAWESAEVVAEHPLGFGTYRFYVDCRVDELDPNVIAGLFTWDEGAPEHHYREIDFEFGRWGDPDADAAQFVVQPHTSPGNLHRFPLDLDGSHSTHAFTWSEDEIAFSSLHGHFEQAPRDDMIADAWTYTGADVPPSGRECVRINLWLMSGDPPTDESEAEIIISRFEFIELAE